MENTGGSRAGHTELGQLVQQRAFARADRAHPASGGGKRLLSANGRSGQSGLTKTKQPPENPGRFMAASFVELAKPANLPLWVTPRFPKPSPKRDRAITKATAVSPLSPRCRSVLRASLNLSPKNGRQEAIL